MTRLSRSPYLLAHPGDTAGCGFHRIMRPFEIMGRNGIMAGRADIQFLPEHMLKALDPEIVIWQRQSDDAQIDIMKTYRRVLPNALFIYEIDDALSAVPDGSWHKPYMPDNVDVQTAKAVAQCDVVAVSTPELAVHMKSICGPDIRVRVVPNMLGKDDILNAEAVRKQPKKLHTKFRIGWGGGIGHYGDLALLNKAFSEFKNEVTWVFLGSKPETPPGVDVEFLGAAQPKDYLKALAAMDVDLMVAPLEDHLFNRCKSNLRLLEAGACMYPVIASPVAPYLNNSPPVFGYAPTEDSWITEIRKFMALGPQERVWAAEKLRRWVERHYIMEDHLEERIQMWLPDGVKPFVPKQHKRMTGKPIIVAIGEVAPEIAELGTVVKTFEEAEQSLNKNGDIVYLRPKYKPTVEQFNRLLYQSDEGIASISILSNDGGLCGFPKSMKFETVEATAGAAIDHVCAEDQRCVPIPAPSGPMILIRRQVLDTIGFPSDDEKVQDFSLIEWGACAAARGFKNVCFLGVFACVGSPLIISQEEAARMSYKISMRWPQQPFDETTFRNIREDIELRFFKSSYSMQYTQNFADYNAWVDLIDTQGPKTLDSMQEWIESEPRPLMDLVVFDPMSETGLADTTSEWVLFVQKDAKLSPEASGILYAAISDHPEAKIIYADHDFLGPDGRRAGHDFKTTFDLHLLFGRDYVTPVMAVHRSVLQLPVIDEVTYTGALLYAAVFGTVKEFGRKTILHVPYILAHLVPPRANDFSLLTAEKASVANAAAELLGMPIEIIPHQVGMGLMLSHYKAPAEQPLVTIIIPTKNKVEMLQPCISTILKMTLYWNYEIVVVNNNTTRQKHLDYLASLSDPRIRVVIWPKDYNWSQLNNEIVAEYANGTYYCFLNDDTRVLSPDWLTEMVGAASIPEVGAVGAKLMYPHGAIQHIGVVANLGTNGHIHKGVVSNSIGYQGLAAISHESTAVTGACMVVRKEVFERVGRFDETFAHNFNDVVFCLELNRLGYRNVVPIRAELQHMEGVTRITAVTEEGKQLLIKEGYQLGTRGYLDPDPYWNPNLQISSVQEGISIIGLNFDVLNFSRLQRPWAKPGMRRVLLVGESNSVAQERHDGSAVYEFGVFGNIGKIMSPLMENVRQFDLRFPDEQKRLFTVLGIEEIIVTSLRNSHPSALAFLTRLGIPTTYRPADAESACPQRDAKPKGNACGGGWKTNGICQVCIDKNGSPNGYVDVLAWRFEWARFINDPLVTIEDGSMPPEQVEIIADVYGMDEDDDENVRAA